MKGHEAQAGIDQSRFAIFLVFLKLGIRSFGGPMAHIAYFREEFVRRRGWLSEERFADLLSLCQFLPGPASSQLGMAIGLSRGGLRGAVAAWLGFTLPSALLLATFALGLREYGADSGTAWVHGLKIAAVAVVAQAIIAMGRALCPDRIRVSIAVAAAGFLLAFPSALGQIVVILMGAGLGRFFLHGSPLSPDAHPPAQVSRKFGLMALLLFGIFLLGLPLIARFSEVPLWKEIEVFYRSGALVFGGGHVVLPLLQAEVVPQGWVSNNDFLAGYGLAQAVPGPLFTFAAYLGAISNVSPSGWGGATVCTVAIFLPAFLLIVAAIPYWESLRRFASIQAAMRGINAAVVGILLAAFYDPLWTTAIQDAWDFAAAVLAFLMLVFWNVPSWAVVGITALVFALQR